MMKQPLVKLRLWIISLAAIVSLAFPAYAGTYVNAAQKAKSGVKGKTQKAASGKVSVIRVRNLDQLKEAFQRDQGKIRLVTILSPT